MNEPNAQVEAATVGPAGFWDVYFANLAANAVPVAGQREAITPEFIITFEYATYDDEGNEVSPATIDPNRYVCLRVRSEARAREFESNPSCIGCISEGVIVFGTAPQDADGEYVSPFA